MYTAPTLIQSIPEQDIQPPSVKPSLQKMDFPNLQRDIPKWKKWLKECFSEEWDRFLKEPFPTSSTEWKLPQILARRYGFRSIKHSDEGQPATDFTYLNPAKSVVSVQTLDLHLHYTIRMSILIAHPIIDTLYYATHITKDILYRYVKL